MVRAPVASNSAASLPGAGLPPTKPIGFMPAAAAAAMPGAEFFDHDACGRFDLAARRREQKQIGRRLAFAHGARREAARIEKAHQTGDFKTGPNALRRRRRRHRLRSADPGQRVCGMRYGSQFAAQTAKRLRGNKGDKIGRQRFSSGRLDSGENVGRPATMEPAHDAGGG